MSTKQTKSSPLPWLIGGGAALAVLAVILVRRSRAKAAAPTQPQLAPEPQLAPQSVPAPSESAVPQEPVLQRPQAAPVSTARVSTARVATAPPRAAPQAAPPRQSTQGPAVLPTIQRQARLTEATASSSAAIRVLQHQLQYLGYEITRVDGRPSAELSRATLSFENDAGLHHFTSNLELLIAVDQRYGHVFDPNNRGVA